MKVLAAVILVLGSVSALKSGPYLPSGWRPQGPAFFLPSEQRPPVVNPPQDFILQESEASGSDFLREYGPPKVSLAEVAPEPAFEVVQARLTEEKTEQAEKTVEVVTEVITDLKYEIVEEVTTTETATTEEASEVVPAQPEVRSNIVEEPVEVEEVKEELKEESSPAEEEVTERAVEAVSELVEETVEGVKNIAEAIDNLEKEEPTQVQISQDFTAVKNVEVDSLNVEKVPEGFLEYGPPGFTEYGPPNLVARSGDDVKYEDEKIENNETRKRRFSPKFRSSKAKKH